MGTIKIAERDGVYVIKMEGDVRLTLCLSFDEFIHQMLAKPDFDSVVFDLTQAHAVDSTTLGLMAKVSILVDRQDHERPLVIANNPGITRLLVSMGFDDIFRLVEKAQWSKSSDCPGNLIALQEKNGKETEVKKTVIEAHRALMDLNEANEVEFKDLVETLEAIK